MAKAATGEAHEREALIASILLAHRLEGLKAQTSMEAWLYRYLPSYFSEAPGELHRGIYSDCEAMLGKTPISGEVRDAAAYAYPRGHGKTTTLITGLSLRAAYEWERMPHFKGKPPFIVIVCDEATAARSRLMDIREEIESNEELHAAYGPLAPPKATTLEEPIPLDQKERKRLNGLKWTEYAIMLRNGVRIMALGSGGKVRGLVRKGRRPTLILIDDLENDENAHNKEQRDKLEKWILRALLPCGIEGDLLTIMIGTVLHADSVLSRLLDPERHLSWLKRRFAALMAEDGTPDSEGTRALWPSQWPVWKLLARKAKIGSLAFNQEYQNQPIGDDTTAFAWAWLTAAMARGRGLGFLYAPPERIPFDVCASTWDDETLEAMAPPDALYQVVVTGWDLGLVDSERKAKESDSDYTVGITLGLRFDDQIEVCRIFRKRGMTPAELRKRVIAEQEITGADYVAIENNQAQRIHEVDLRNAGLPIVGHTTDKKKHSVYEGVPGMALQFELDRIDLCWKTPQERARVEILRSELFGLGLEAHDDTVMALWIALSVLRRWVRRRDATRLKLIGPRSEAAFKLFPSRYDDDEHEARAA